jgi:LPXTG-motif cell wall-anchored protein
MQQLRMMLAVGGIAACLIGAMLLAMPSSPALAQSLPERPTLTPTAAPREDEEAKPVALGRITGTVIDSRTGYPTAGMRVQVGDLVVVSDANGNYDRNGLLPGSYMVSLQVSADQGIAEQGTLSISLAEGATVVQHLAFRSPVPAEPVVVQEPTPVALPATGGNDAGGLLLVLGISMLMASAVIRRRV